MTATIVAARVSLRQLARQLLGRLARREVSGERSTGSIVIIT